MLRRRLHITKTDISYDTYLLQTEIDQSYFFANASDDAVNFRTKRSGASEACALHTRRSRLRRFAPSE